MILNGDNVLATSPTASGKTEAAVAPLIERFIARSDLWTILYVIPTRALVNDLYNRLTGPCHGIGLNVVRRTGEYRTISKHPHLLLTTPESFDSLMCRGRIPGGHLLARVTAIVLDEIHLLADTARGEQTRWLIERLRRLKEYAAEQKWTGAPKSMQIIALSASLHDPEDIVKRFLYGRGEIVKTSAKRAIEVIAPEGMGQSSIDRTTAFLNGSKDPQKILLFCNARQRVDELAHEFLKLVPAEYKVLAHHGSLAKASREEAEETLKTSKSVLMVSTSTLEIGIDIGDIDVVGLDVPPHDIGALLQRIGRGNRRSATTRVLPCGRSPNDALLHEAMIHCAEKGLFGGTWNGTHYAAAIQQIASFIWQSASHFRRRETIIALVSSMLDRPTADELLGGLLVNDVLIESSSGIKLGEQLEKLAELGQIHTVIEDVGGLTVREEVTGKIIASQVSPKQAEKLTIGGKPLDVREERQRMIDVRLSADATNVQTARYVPSKYSPKMALPYAIRTFLGLGEDVWPVLPAEDETFVFHLGGFQVEQIYRLMANSSGQARYGACDQYCIRIKGNVHTKPNWLTTGDAATLYPSIEADLDRLENVLQRPRANKLLPVSLRVKEVHSWLNVGEVHAKLLRSQWNYNCAPNIRESLELLVGLKIEDGEEP